MATCAVLIRYGGLTSDFVSLDCRVARFYKAYRRQPSLINRDRYRAGCMQPDSTLTMVCEVAEMPRATIAAKKVAVGRGEECTGRFAHANR